MFCYTINGPFSPGNFVLSLLHRAIIPELTFSVKGSPGCKESQFWSLNRRQNELRHFAQNWAFLRFINFKRRNIASPPPPSPPCNVVPLFQLWLPIENNKHSNFEWRGQGRGADSFVLRIQCLNNFVADCLNLKSGRTSFRKLIEFISLRCDVRPPVAFYLLCSTSSYLFQNNYNKAISLFSVRDISCHA